MTGTMTTLRVAALMTVFALLCGAESAARVVDAPGQLMVESEPAGAVVYVDGRFAGQTPLTLPTVDAGAHRVRVVHDGFLENSRLVTIKSGARAMLQTQLTPAPQQLKIVVVEGEGAVNIIQQKTAVAPVIEVRDRNDQPVSGAAVRFAIQKGKATFDGARTLTLTTDSLGRATAAGLTPTGSGALQIGATATFQGQSAAVAIAQTNVATAAQAAAAASGTGAASGGGMSHLAIAGIVGGAGAGVAAGVAAAKASSSPSATFSPAGTWTYTITANVPLTSPPSPPSCTAQSFGTTIASSDGTFSIPFSGLTCNSCSMSGTATGTMGRGTGPGTGPNAIASISGTVTPTISGSGCSIQQPASTALAGNCASSTSCMVGLINGAQAGFAFNITLARP